MTFLFLTEAGNGRGSGHGVRTGAVAEMLAESGENAVFIIDSPEPHFNLQIIGRFKWQKMKAELFELIKEQAPDGIFVDSYSVGLALARELLRLDIPLFFMDDLGLDYPGGIIFAPFPLRVYPKMSGRTVYKGIKYIPLRKAFAEKATSTRSGIVISFGGTEQSELIRTAVQALEGYNGEITVVGASPKLSGVTILAPNQSSEKMAELFACTEIVICAGGGTLNEAAATGTPAIVVQIADNQNACISFWKTAGFALCAGDKSDPSLGSQIKVLVTKLQEPEVWKKASLAGRSLCDGKGARRITGVMIDEAAKRKRGRLLRESYKKENYILKNYIACSKIENKLTLDVRNSEAVRVSSINQTLITPQVHAYFLAKLSTSLSSGYWFVLENGKPLGSMSLTGVNLQKNEAYVGIFKFPDAKKRGVGLILMELAKWVGIEILGLRYIFADCFDDNVASWRSCERAGFVLLYTDKDNDNPDRAIRHYVYCDDSSKKLADRL